MMSEAIDETLDKDEAEEETEDLTNQVRYCNFYHRIHTQHTAGLFSPRFLYLTHSSVSPRSYRCLMRLVLVLHLRLVFLN